MKLILEENDALPGEDERIIHDNSGEAKDTDTKEQNEIDKEVIKELEKRVDYVEDEINDADTPKPEATSGDGKSKGVDGLTKAIKIKEKLTLPEPEDILSEAIDFTGLDDGESEKDPHWVNTRKLAMLGQADDYGYDEYDLDEAIPKDAISAYKSAPGYNPSARGSSALDYQKSELKEITPEEAQEFYKNGNGNHLRLLIGGRLVKLNDRGKGDTEYRNQYVGRDQAYYKKNGDEIRDTRYMPKNHLFQIADKIYLANEVRKDPAMMAARAENPESKT